MFCVIYTDINEIVESLLRHFSHFFQNCCDSIFGVAKRKKASLLSASCLQPLKRNPNKPIYFPLKNAIQQPCFFNAFFAALTFKLINISNTSLLSMELETKVEKQTAFRNKKNKQ